MQHKLLLFISVFFIPGACSKNNKPINLTEQIQALKIIPSSQNGYGKDADQLAQPDDVELLPDGSMIVTDVDNNRIQYFSSEGLLQKSITARELGLTNEEIIPTVYSFFNTGTWNK